MNTLAAIIQFEEYGEWLESVFDEVQDKYANTFVAVKNKSIIATAEKLDSLLELLERMDVSPDEVLVQFIHGKEFTYIL